MTSGRDECGVFAAYAPGENVAKLCFYGLYALQHRGQESAGIAVSDGRHILVRKEMGLVSAGFNESRLAGMDGHLGIGHVRYSTTGGSTWENAQPAFHATAAGGGFALAHNGNLVNTSDLARIAGKAGDGCTTDSALLAELLSRGEEPDLEQTIAAVCAQAQGAYSMVVMDERTIYAIRDPHGIRPLVLGRLDRRDHGWIIASETVALDIVGAAYVRDVLPGELVAIDDDGLRSHQLTESDPHFCVFEYVYVARPDHRVNDCGTVYSIRHRMGELLAAEAPVDADLVIPVPDSGTAAAAGYAEASGIPYTEGLTKNRYVGRTFIQPTQSLRQLGIRLKLNPLRDVIGGQRLVVVDDSIVRGNTSRQLVAMLRQAGATQIHLRITSPPVRHPCFYGIDMATHDELIASELDVEGVRAFLGADSLAYLSLDGLVQATGRPGGQLCRACFDGCYPIPVPAEQRAAGKDVLVALRAGP